MISEEKLTELIVEVHNKNCGIDHSHKDSAFLLHQCVAYRCATDGILAGLNATRTVYAAMQSLPDSVKIGRGWLYKEGIDGVVIRLFNRLDDACLEVASKFEEDRGAENSYYVKELELRGSY